MRIWILFLLYFVKAAHKKIKNIFQFSKEATMSFGKLKFATKLIFMFGTMTFFILCVSAISFYSLDH